MSEGDAAVSVQAQFDLAPGELIRSGGVRIIALAIFTLGLYVAGKADDIDLAAGVGLPLFSFLMFLWVMKKEAKAKLTVDSQGITWGGHSKTMTFAWPHIISLENKTAGRWLSGGHPEYVEIKLSQSPTTNLISDHSRTGKFGLPFFKKTFNFHIANREDFLRTAEYFRGYWRRAASDPHV